MRKLLFFAVLVGVLVPGHAQNTKNRREWVIARIAYENTNVENAHDVLSPPVCFALYSGRTYRMARTNPFGMWEWAQGQLTNEEFTTFEALLKDLDFESRGGMVRGGAESFTAEIRNGLTRERHSWINPDDERPLPSSAAKVTRWIQSFQPKDATSFEWEELGQDPVCPSGDFTPLRPTLSYLF